MKPLVGALAFALVALPASAQTLEGQWHGEPHLPLTLRVGLAVARAADGSLKAASTTEAGIGESADWIINETGDSAKLSTPAGNGQRIEVKWDAIQGAWVGHFYNTSGEFPITLLPGPLPPPPRIEGLDGDWAGKLSLGDMSLRVVLHVKTQGASTTAILDSPDQAAYAIKVSSLSHAGGTAGFEIPSLGLTYSGTLSPDGATLEGKASAPGISLPLRFTKSN